MGFILVWYLLSFALVLYNGKKQRNWHLSLILASQCTPVNVVKPGMDRKCLTEILQNIATSLF